MSDRLVERIYEFLGRPQFDPHGAPIPCSDGSFIARDGVTLDELEAGASGKVLRVADDDSEFLRYLTRLNVRIGSSVRVLERAPFGGPISVLFGRNRADLGVEGAKRIVIERAN
jgi:DtxR family Mn-dependent transcriptional regulator